MKQLEFIFWFLGWSEFFHNRRLRCTFLRGRANVQKTSGVTASVIKNLGLPAGVKWKAQLLKAKRTRWAERNERGLGTTRARDLPPQTARLVLLPGTSSQAFKPWLTI